MKGMVDLGYLVFHDKGKDFLMHLAEEERMITVKYFSWWLTGVV